MTNPNDPAHPQHGWSKDPETLERMKNQGGLTKREYIAAMAMQGICANGAIEKQAPFYKDSTPQSADISLWAIEQADALIAELNKEPKP